MSNDDGLPYKAGKEQPLVLRSKKLVELWKWAGFEEAPKVYPKLRVLGADDIFCLHRFVFEHQLCNMVYGTAVHYQAKSPNSKAHTKPEAEDPLLSTNRGVEVANIKGTQVIKFSCANEGCAFGLWVEKDRSGTLPFRKVEDSGPCEGPGNTGAFACQTCDANKRWATVEELDPHSRLCGAAYKVHPESPNKDHSCTITGGAWKTTKQGEDAQQNHSYYTDKNLAMAIATKMIAEDKALAETKKAMVDAAATVAKTARKKEIRWKLVVETIQERFGVVFSSKLLKKSKKHYIGEMRVCLQEGGPCSDLYTIWLLLSAETAKGPVANLLKPPPSTVTAAAVPLDIASKSTMFEGIRFRDEQDQTTVDGGAVLRSLKFREVLAKEPIQVLLGRKNSNNGQTADSPPSLYPGDVVSLDDPEILRRGWCPTKQLPKVEWMVHWTNPSRPDPPSAIFLLDRKGKSQQVDPDWDLRVVCNNQAKPVCTVYGQVVVNEVDGERVNDVDIRYAWSIRTMMDQDPGEKDMQRLAIVTATLSDEMVGKWERHCQEEDKMMEAATKEKETPGDELDGAARVQNMGVDGVKDSNTEAAEEEKSAAESESDGEETPKASMVKFPLPEGTIKEPKGGWIGQRKEFLRNYVNERKWMFPFLRVTGANGKMTKKDYVATIKACIAANERALAAKNNGEEDSDGEDKQKPPARKKLRSGLI